MKVDWRGESVVALDASSVHSTSVSAEMANRIRASFLAAGPLLARFGEAMMAPPGGDVIGRRRLDPHLDAFKSLGASVDMDRACSYYRLTAPEGGLKACDFFLDEPSVMATENALMAAALTPGETLLHNAASEPHVQDLAHLLCAMGAEISGIGSNIDDRAGPGQARRRRLHDRPGLHRDRQLHRAGGGHGRRASRSPTRGPATCG